MKDQTNEQRPAPVAATPPQAGETRDRWWWVERCVWTERMLTRLTSGEPADRVWFALVDKTHAPANLQSAFEKVWRKGGSAGADRQTVAHFERRAEEELRRLHEQLRAGTYRPQPVRRAWIPKPGSKEKRPLGIPAVRDRIVQGALRHVLEPIFETDFAEHSYGFRPGKGAKDALRRVDELLKAGHHWVVDADLKSYFDTIPHDRLLALVESFLRAGVLEAQQALAAVQAWVSEAGLTLHPEKTRVVDATQRGGFDFLGYHFERGMRWPRQKSLKKLRERIRKKTPRLAGRSLKAIMADVNRSLRGLVWVFPAQQGQHVCGGGRLREKTDEEPAGEATGPDPARAGSGAPTLAERMVCAPWAAEVWRRNMSGRVQS